MKIQHLLIVFSFPILLALSGCEAKKPATEANVEPVGASTSVAPVSEPSSPKTQVEEAALAPQPAPEHCAKHKPGKQHDCVKHCAKHKGKKDKECKNHCAHKALEEHDCKKHCAEHPEKKDQVCAQHCSQNSSAKAHACGTEHCAHHEAEAAKNCDTEHCADHKGSAAHICGTEHCQKHAGNMADCCESNQKCDIKK